MKQLLKITALEEISHLHSSLPMLHAQDLLEYAADEHWILYDENSLLARCSLWWRSPPSYAGNRTGIIGHYSARAGDEAMLLLDHACARLREQGCEYALGPMDGSTWRGYRLMTLAGSEPPFFLEPDTPPDWPAHWQASGFAPVAEYSSRLNTDLNYQDPRLMSVAQRMAAQNVTIRTLAMNDFAAELTRIFALSCVSFRDNFLYTSLAQSTFIKMYSQLETFVRPELVLLAEREEQLVGFLFALPDWLQAKHGANIDTVIIKTVAVLPGRAYAGLGNLLAARCHSAARELGYTRAIHALMHDSNHSRNVSSRYAHVMRRYALFGKEL